MMIYDLLHLLVCQANDRAVEKMLPVSDDRVNEVLLESDVDGEHYYLVRCRSKDSDRPHLSDREQQIATLVARGLPNKQIAKALDISPWTVATHLKRMFSKLGVCSRSAMIARFMEEHSRPN
jgi:two-component system, NarL family, nitrate/nitrite response regulator NarL